MTPFRSALCLVVFVAVTAVAAETKLLPRNSLLKNAATNPVALSRNAARGGFIPTNTLAYREYALGMILTQANFVNEKLSLGLAPITEESVTRFGASPRIKGVGAGIIVSNRYSFLVVEGKLQSVADQQDCWKTLAGDVRRLELLTSAPNRLTKTTALQVARDGLLRLGLTQQPYFNELPTIEQQTYLDKQDKLHPLPFYVLRWASTSMEIEVSGMSGRIVSYWNAAAPVTIAPPTNYYAMLGISPERNTWGTQYGYETLDTTAFRAFATNYVRKKLNEIITQWAIPSPPVANTNISWFLARPHTNSFEVSARFGERFQLQIGDGRITLFLDDAYNKGAFVSSAESFKAGAATAMVSKVGAREAEAIARTALAKAGIDLKKLQVREPPTVTQMEMAFEPGENEQKLPLFDVFWSPAKEDPDHGVIDPAIGVQVSGVTGKVVMFANNSALTSKFPLPTNYSAVISGVKRRE